MQSITQGAHSISAPKLTRSKTSFAFIAILFGFIAVLNTGCQTARLGNTDIPVPPPILDSKSLDNVRFQSADPIGSGTQNRDYSRKMPAPDYGQGSLTGNSDTSAPLPDKANMIREVIIRGNQLVPTHHLSRNIQTRPGRYFDPDKLQQDVDQLWRMPEISRINGPYLKNTDEGIIVTIEVVERNTIGQVEFIGNRGIPDRTLKKETGLDDGKPLDVHEIRMAKSKIEDLYKEKGYPRTQVEIVEGGESGDSKVVFLIHEDEKQRIWKVDFEGNTIATDARLRHFIQSKPGILKVFGGLVKRDEIEQDINRLTQYYRSLGFFNARIGREIVESNDGRWLTLQFIINEGPRYRVRSVSFIGNDSFTEEQLTQMLDLKPTGPAKGQPEFNVAKMNRDTVSLRDLYGSQGFVFSKVEVEPRFLEEPGLLDLVYKIDEGNQYRVGDINVHFEGDFGLTKREVVLSRLSVRPGDLIDARKIRNSERRLGSAQIFAAGAAGSSAPRIVVRPPELKELERYAKGPSGSSHR
ncbi:MAG: outer membrane protein assembly factor [Mariniblastus sp.]